MAAKLNTYISETSIKKWVEDEKARRIARAKTDGFDPLPDFAELTLQFMGDTDQALFELEKQVFGMYEEFVRWRARNPEDPRGEVKAKQFERIWHLINFLFRSTMSASMWSQEVQRLRWTVTQQRDILEAAQDEIRQRDGVIKELQEQITKQAQWDERNGGIQKPNT